MKIMEQIGQQLKAQDAPGEPTLNAALREKILTSIPDELPERNEVYVTEPRPRRAPYQNLLFQTGIVATTIMLFVVVTTVIGGRKISNTFNAASSGMIDGPAASESSPAVSAASPASSARQRLAKNDMATEAAKDRIRSTTSGATNPTFSIGDEPTGVTLPAPPAAGSVMSKAATRHLDGANYGFADGEVKWYKGRQANEAQRYARGEPRGKNEVAGDDKAAIGMSRGAAPTTSGDSDASNLPSSLRRVHQEARIAVAVADLEEKSNSVISLVKSSGGFIANNTLVTGADGLQSATLTVRVPVRRFETVLAEIGKLGDVKAKNITGEDVTEQFSDAQQADIVIGSELTVKESILKAALLKAEKAEKEGKPFATNWQLRTEVRRLRIEAAQARARLDLLKKISDLANIEVELREKSRKETEGGFAQQLGDTSRTAMESFLLAARLPIMLLIWVLAYTPLWLPVLLIYRYATRAYQKKMTQP
jgi:prepilin-type processing-associated H-X9-DG protein